MCSPSPQGPLGDELGAHRPRPCAPGLVARGEGRGAGGGGGLREPGASPTGECGRRPSPEQYAAWTRAPREITSYFQIQQTPFIRFRAGKVGVGRGGCENDEGTKLGICAGKLPKE